MEEEKRLYPLKFKPVAFSQPWGEESYDVADLGFVESEVSRGFLEDNSLGDLMDTYLERIVGDKVYYYYGRQFPLGVRRFAAASRTPLVVCPDDALAGPRFDALGKMKVWVVLQAEPGAKLWIGLDRAIDASSFYAACLDGSVASGLREIPAVAGSAHVISPGTVHCAGPGVKILEISEASALDFVLCAWGKGVDDEGLGLAEALDFVNFGSYAEPPRPEGDEIFKGREMNLTKVTLREPLKVTTGRTDSFILYCCADGEAAVRTDEGETLLGAGESLVIPAEIPEYFLVPRREGTVLYEALMDPGALPESYINQII